MEQSAIYYFLGSAAGAISAGLIVYLVTRNQRKILEFQLAQAEAYAQTARHATVRMHRYANRITELYELKCAELKQEQEARDALGSKPWLRLVDAYEPDSTAMKEGGRNFPAISSSKDGMGSIKDRVRVERSFDPAKRSSVINRRLPFFDESLFPDKYADNGEAVDEFAMALKAMDDSMPLRITHMESESFSPVNPPAFSDAASYVEFLVEDEMRRIREEEKKRHAERHLTVIDGTGDVVMTKSLSSKRRYLPKHMAQYSLEA